MPLRSPCIPPTGTKYLVASPWVVPIENRPQHARALHLLIEAGLLTLPTNAVFQRNQSFLLPVHAADWRADPLPAHKHVCQLAIPKGSTITIRRYKFNSFRGEVTIGVRFQTSGPTRALCFELVIATENLNQLRASHVTLPPPPLPDKILLPDPIHVPQSTWLRKQKRK